MLAVVRAGREAIETLFIYYNTYVKYWQLLSLAEGLDGVFARCFGGGERAEDDSSNNCHDRGYKQRLPHDYRL